MALLGPAALTQAENFAVLGWSVRYVTTREGAFVRGAREPQTDGIAFRYVAAIQAHEMLIPGYDWGRLQAPQQTNREFSLQNVLIANTSASLGYRLSLFLPGSQNPRLALTQTSLGFWEAGDVDPSDPNLVNQNYGDFAYGVPTVAGDVPTTGTAIYDAYVGGYGGYVEGTAELRFDFANGTLTGSMEVGLYDGTGGLGTTGRFDFTEVTFAPGGTTFSGRLAVPGAVSDSFFEGRFTGPGASELMVRWQARVTDPHNPAERIMLYGVWVGRRR